MKYHIKLSIKNMRKQKTGSLINIIGLSVSLAACLIIVLFIQEELSFDKFNEKGQQIYRLLDVDNSKRYPDHPVIFNKILKENLPELGQGTMLYYYNKTTDFFRYKHQDYFFNNLVFSTHDFFNIFTVEFVRGNPESALNLPNKIVLTESSAAKIFGDENPIGKTLNYENVFEFEVSGVIKDLPGTSHFQIDLLASLQAQESINPHMLESWSNSSTSFYYLLHENTDIGSLEGKIAELFKKNRPESIISAAYQLQPLLKIHLHSNDTSWDSAIKGDIKVVLSFILIAILIFGIACFNYINLSMALLKKRIYYTAIQKTMGADGKSIFKSTLIENLILMLICTVTAVTIAQLFIPGFNSIMGTNLTISFENQMILGLLFCFIVILTVVSSLFQTWHRKRISPIAMLSGRSKQLFFRKTKYFSTLTILQLVISIILIIGVITIHKQTILVMDTKLGFNKSQLISVKNPYDDNVHKRYKLFKDQANNLVDVKGVAASWNVPGEYINNYNGVSTMGDSKKVHFGQVPIDNDFFRVLETDILHGRTFDKSLSSDSSKVIINKIGMDRLGLTDPIGKQVINSFNGDKVYEIAGVVDDVQYRSLQENGKPVIYYLTHMGFSKILVRMNPGDIQETLKSIQQVWRDVEPKHPFEFEFIDQKIQANYTKEIRTRTVLSIMAFLAISISMLGIFGLGVSLTQNRTKEIGIRKVNGAKTVEIITMLNKGFVAWVAIAFVIACPIAWYAMNQWLQNFAYKTDLSWWIFALAGIIALGIALLTVSWQSWRAARRNPVESLRYE